MAAAAALALDVTLVINKAGIAQLGGFLADDSEDLARHIFSNQLLRNVDNEQFFRIHSQEQWWRQLTKCSIGRLMGEWGELAAYSANKSAAWSLTNALRNELAGQKTQVMELHMAYNDTDLTRGFDVPKSSPAQIVQRALDGLKSGTDAVLADEITRQVKKGKGPRLPAIQGPYQQLGF